MSPSKIGIQSLNIKADNRTAVMPDGIDGINSQTRHEQYNMVGMMT